MSVYQLATNLTEATFPAGPKTDYNLRLASDVSWPIYQNENITRVYLQFTIFANSDMRYSAAWENTTANLIKIEKGNNETRTIDIPSDYWTKEKAKIVLSNANWGSTTSFTAYARNICMVFETEPNATASTINSVSEANVGGSQTVSLSQSNPSSVYHVLTWSYSKNGTVVLSGTQTIESGTLSASWIVPDQNISNLFGPSDTVVYGTVKVDTYLLNGTLVGSNTATGQNVKLYLPQSLAGPVIGFSLSKGWVPGVDSATKTRYENDYLQNFSTVTITPNITYKYGASASQQDAVQYATTENTTPQTISGTSVQITVGRSGSYVITVYATDTRGYMASASQTLRVVSCEPPGFSSLVVHRCKSATDIDPDDEGSFLYVTGSVTFDKSSSLNSVNIRVNNTEHSATISGSSFSTVVNAQLGKEQSSMVTVIVTDNMGLTNQRIVTIASALYTIYRLAGGKAVAFGKPAELLGVEVAPNWPFYTHGQEIEKLIVDCAHPVGSVLQTFDDGFNPNEKWTWTLWTKLKDVFLYATGTKLTAQSGGSTENGINGYVYEYPADSGRYMWNSPGNMLMQGDGNLVVYSEDPNVATWSTGTYSSSPDPSYGHYAFTFGETAPAVNENNMPPYLTVNMWVRVR